MSDQDHVDAPTPPPHPTMSARGAVPQLHLSDQEAAESMARHKHAYGRSRWACAAHFFWQTISNLSAIVYFLRWLVSPLLGGTPNPIVSAINNSTPSGFCTAPPDGSWCAICVDAKLGGPGASSRTRGKCANVSLHWTDSSSDLSITRTNTIEITALVGDRILGAASNDGTLLLCCGGSGRVSLYSVGSQGDSVALDVPAGPWSCDVGGCAILSASHKSVLRHFLFVCDASGRFFVASTFQASAAPAEQTAHLSWRWRACKSRSNLKVVHFLSQMNDSSFIIGGLGHVNFCGALEIYGIALEDAATPVHSASDCIVNLVRTHSSKKNELPFPMCISASSGPRGILAAFNDGSVAMLSPSPLHSVEKVWSPDAFLASTAGSASAVDNALFSAWSLHVVRVGWWAENAVVVIRRNGCCSLHSLTTSHAIKLLGPLHTSKINESPVASEVDNFGFLGGTPSATCFSQGTLKGSVWSVCAAIAPSTHTEVVYLKASDVSSVFSSLIKRSCDSAMRSSDVNANHFSGARDFYLKFQSSCVPGLSFDSLLVAEFVASKQPLEQRILLLPQMSSAIVIERAVRQVVCSLPELIFHLETTILNIDIVRNDDVVHSELVNTLLWARIFGVSGREGLDFMELIKLSGVPIWAQLKVLDESTFPRSYREYICKRIVGDEVADVALAMMICDAPLLFHKHALVDDILFHFWNYCASSYPEICNRMCLFEEVSFLRNLLPSAEGCPLRIYEKRNVREAVDSGRPKDAGRWSAIGFLDRSQVLSWYRNRIALIESETGNISNVRDLLEVAVSLCNLKELASDLDDACDLYGFLYMAPISNISCHDANLVTFRLYSPAQRLWRILSTFPLEDVPSAIVGVGRELVDRHNMQYSSLLDCVQHWAFDRGSSADLHSPRRNASSHTGAIEYYKYDFLFAASALESLIDSSIDVLGWDDCGEVIIDLVCKVCMRSSTDDEELDAVSRLLNLYKNISGFSSTESRQSSLAKLSDIDAVRAAADVCRVRDVDPFDFDVQCWTLNTLSEKRGDAGSFELMCGKIVDKAISCDDFEISDPEFLRRDLTTLAMFMFGSAYADEVIGPVLLGALLQLRLWDKASDYAKTVVSVSSKDIVFKSFQVCMSNTIVYFENPSMALADCIHDAELCLQLAKDLVASSVLDSNSDDETRKIDEFNEIIHKQETLHRIASLLQDCGLENVQLPQISLAYFGHSRQRRDIVDAVISEAPAIAPSQVMQLLEWFSLKDSKKDAVEVLSNATVQAFDSGRISDAFELAKELCIFGQGESLPWAMLCKLSRQAQSDDSSAQQSIVSTAVLHAPASEILDERNDRHWHVTLSSEGGTMFGVGADMVLRLLCDDFRDVDDELQWRRMKRIIVDVVCGAAQPSSLKALTQCLLQVRDNKCLTIHPKTVDRALELVLELENIIQSVQSFGKPEYLQMLCKSDDDDVVSIVDDIMAQDEIISGSLLKSILRVIERPEIARTRSESYILNVYKLGLSPSAMQEAVSCLSQFLPPWSWRHTLAEVTLRDQVSASVPKGMLKCIVFSHAMSEVDPVVIGDIDYSLPYHSDESLDDRVQVLASVGGSNALIAAKQMQMLLENGVDLSLSEIMSICWQADRLSCFSKAIDLVHMVIGPSVETGHVFGCMQALLNVIQLLGMRPFCGSLSQYLWEATSLVCTQDRLFGDALSALELSGDFGLKLLLASQSLDNFGVNATSLISLLVKMRSSSLGASSKPSPTVLTSACCAAASFLTIANAFAYRLLLAKFGDDPVVCTFIIFALGGELVETFGSTRESSSSSLLQIGVERIIHELPDRMHRAPLDDVQRAVVSVVCDALDHTDSPSLLSEVSVAVSATLERICDIAREQLAPAVSRVTRLLSSTCADLTHSLNALTRMLSINIDQKPPIQDQASVLLGLLPSCKSVELVAAALNVLHAIQGRPTFDASSCDDDFSAVEDCSVLDVPGNNQHAMCWRTVLCHCFKFEKCADLALLAYAISGRLALSADDEDVVYNAAPSSHASTFRCLSLRRDVRAAAFASMIVTPWALGALALSSLSRDFEAPDSLPCSESIIQCLKSTDGCTIALHACATTYAVPLSRSEIARLVACLLLKQRGLRCAALVLADCDCVPVSRALTFGRGGLAILRKSIKEGIENGMLMITRSHYRQVKDKISRDSSA